MRYDNEKLRACPVCSTDVSELDLGLRDYQWLNKLLPGRVGAMDVDLFLEQSRTGRALVCEYKPGKFIPTGQRLSLQWFKKKGADVWLVIDSGLKKKGTVQVAEMREDGTNDDWQEMTVEEFANRITEWWQAGLKAA